MFDALKRRFQCATVQLDFQLPIRFNLSYVSEANEPERPIIIHRAILGSVERMFAILTEHFAGKWPFWLSPRQVMIVPVSELSRDYAHEVRTVLRKEGFYCEVDDSDRKMQKKVREAQLEQWNYILVVGEGEKTNRTVNIRTRDNVVHGEHKLEEGLLETLLRERKIKSLTCLFGVEKSAAAAEQVEEPSVAEKAASFFADPSEGRKGFVDTLLGAGGARARSRRGLQAPRNLADPLSRLTGKEPKEVGLWDKCWMDEQWRVSPYLG